ncbi:MAG: LytTR family DNA-binding domain-containing protein [Bacteroidota bacterium]
MMKSVKTFLASPFPLGHGFGYVIVPGVIVFLLLFTLRPFDFGALDHFQSLVKAAIFGVITSTSVFLHFFIGEKWFPNIYNEESWNIQKELWTSILDIALIGFWNTVFLKLFELERIPFLHLLWFIEKHTFLIGLFPTLVIIFMKHNQLLKQQLSLAHELNRKLDQSKDANIPVGEPVVLKDEKGNPELQLAPTDIRMIKSDGNYVDIFFADEGSINKKLLRNRIKNVLAELPTAEFFQCHKSYVVNFKSIREVSGNARDLRLSIAGMDEHIPVSRTKASELRQVLKVA